MLTVYPVLSIAGSDSSGGAGIQADIKTISAIGCYAMTAITAITAQNTTGVRAVQGIDPTVVRAQLEAVWDDIPPLAIKIGMLYDKAIIDTVADVIEHAFESHKQVPLIIDPVMVSTSGSLLIAEDAVDTMIKRLFPLATLITPNQSEARALTGSEDYMEQISKLHAMGAAGVLIKGGDTPRTDVKIDYLSITPETNSIALTADAVRTVNSHGTGCTMSSAIASYMALGYDVTEAVRKAKLFVTKALETASFLHVGSGHGPTNHLFSPRRMKIRNVRQR